MSQIVNTNLFSGKSDKIRKTLIDEIFPNFDVSEKPRSSKLQ